jgi:signal peptidase I
VSDASDAANGQPPPSNGLVLDTDDLTADQRRSHRLATLMLLPLTLLLGVAIGAWVVYDFSIVDGPSMLPTLRDKDYLLITKGLPDPQRGDVTVVRMREGQGTVELVKRIIALEGDEVHIEGDHVWVNGAEETRTAEVIYSGASQPRGTLTVPPGHVWIMGDNRPNSTDSRMFGPVPMYSLHGRAVAIWAPIQRAGLVPSR